MRSRRVRSDGAERVCGGVGVVYLKSRGIEATPISSKTTF